MSKLSNKNISSSETMYTPSDLHKRIPVSEAAAGSVQRGRAALFNILDRKDHRVFVVVGPCSIHDPVAGLDYAHRLKLLSDKVSDTLVLVMRVYFEKPRTTVGWKGYVNDPFMDKTFKIEVGMEKARQFLLDVCEIGLPIGTEALDLTSPQYYGELISWTAIGARTTESQTHREMSSGLMTPVGFKNGTNGDIGVAINAIKAASQPHSFLGINLQGQIAIVRTEGNKYGHLIMRGSEDKANYGMDFIALAETAMDKVDVNTNIVVDCSHGNSFKKPELQPQVMLNVVDQICRGNKSLVGLMIESNIEAGKQKIPNDLKNLRYGCSVTDACIDWQTTEKVILESAELLRKVLPKRSIDFSTHSS